MDARAVKPLIAALKDGDWKVRLAAAQALREIKDRRAVEPLIAALKDGDVGVRLAAVEALMEMQDRRAVEPLIAALEDERLEICMAAAQALEAFGVMIKGYSSVVAHEQIVEPKFKMIKTCSACGKEVDRSSGPGQHCPHCGVLWSVDKTNPYNLNWWPPENSSRIIKTCDACKKEVPLSSGRGQRCPHCGALWISEKTR